VTSAAPASLPPAGLTGLDPAWSRLVATDDPQGTTRTWHVLEAGPQNPVGTLLCIHGNPTWSYTFRSILTSLGDRWRVIAPDHLGMGYSERTGKVHRLADRVAELTALTNALDVSGPVVTVAHDWGGSISLGWAQQHHPDLTGIVLLNTAVSQPPDAAVPRLIRWARSRTMLNASTRRTETFLRGTLRLAHPPLSREVVAAYRAPYRGAARRQSIADFVADIPLEPEHPSSAVLTKIADNLPALADIPTLLVWGPRDPVFGEPYLRDLQRRIPSAKTHRFEGAGHLVVEDAPVAAAVSEFVNSTVQTEAPPSGPALDRRTLWSHIEARSQDQAPAVVEMGRGKPRRTVSWQALHETVRDLAAGLHLVGVAPGDRVALLIPPGADLTAVVYACWRAGAVPVIADAGLGLTGLRRALRGARTQHLIGVSRGLAAARTMGLSGNVVSVGSVPPGAYSALGVDYSLVELRQIGRGRELAAPPQQSAEAAVLFTSGATGPAKGVVYRHLQLEAQRDVVQQAFNVSGSDRLVAAFAPFALFGPALGITSVVPDMDVTQPGSLSARSLADAVDAVDATMVFAAPAALRNIVRTAPTLRQRQRNALSRVRLLLSAGAPVPSKLLRQASDLMGGCEAHTPYGMTEALPLCDTTLAEIERAGRGNGVLVGRPLKSVQVAISAVDERGSATGPLTDRPDVSGEICVRAPHMKDHYDQLWLTEQASGRDSGWHRTGDVGHLDADGLLWNEGRLVHVITTALGVVTPVGIEQAVEELDSVRLAAAVGVGPTGTQVVVVVVEAPSISPGLAPLELIDAVRAAADCDVAAVLVVRKLPVDIRHNSKIDRVAVATDAARLLSGTGSEQA
jgi:cis-3-alkyl-4-acyloxetan-2-one decarboxylase / olefin beta-lactone synthetase